MIPAFGLRPMLDVAGYREKCDPRLAVRGQLDEEMGRENNYLVHKRIKINQLEVQVYG